MLYQFLKGKIPIIWRSVNVGADCSYGEVPLTVSPHIQANGFQKKKKATLVSITSMGNKLPQYQ
jgi:hypothetical protein